MSTQTVKQPEQFQSGKQVLFRLAAFVVGLTVLLVVVKMLLE